MTAGVSVDGLGRTGTGGGAELLGGGVIAGTGMFLALNSWLSKGSAPSRNRKSATNNTATLGSCWPTPPAPPRSAVVVRCQEQTHNSLRQCECVFDPGRRVSRSAEIQQMWPLYPLFFFFSRVAKSRARAETRSVPSCTSGEPGLPGDGVLVARSGAAV